MSNNHKLTFASVCLACCFLLPLLTAHNPQVNLMLCLMHFPVMVCGMMCGAPWGVAVGVTAPVLRSLMFGMPAMYPEAVAMCFELGVYGLVCGLEANDPRKSPANIFIDLILAMVAGRIAWGAAMLLFALVSSVPFSVEIFKDAVLNTCHRTITDIFEQYGMVPKALVQAGLMLVAQSYQHREPASPQNLYAVPYAFDLLLKPYIKLTT